MSTFINKERAESFTNVMNQLSKRTFGKEPAEAVLAGECLGCGISVDKDSMHVARQERYEICGMCSDCQANWLPAEIFDSRENDEQFKGQWGVPKRFKQPRYKASLQKIVRAMKKNHPYKPIEIEERAGVAGTTVMRHLQDMQQHRKVSQIEVYGKVMYVRLVGIADAMS